MTPNAARMAVASVLLLVAHNLAWSLDLAGVQPLALDQPRLNAAIWALPREPGDTPLVAPDIFGFDSINIEAFLDTGASGILFSEATAARFGLVREHFPAATDPPVTFSDIGIAGGAVFNVSEPIDIALAPFEPHTDITDAGVYTMPVAGIRAQIGPVGPNASGFDVVGMPAMQGRVVVMDPKPLSTLLDTMHTYLYAPETVFNDTSPDSNPGIPEVNRHLRLSFASFDEFSATSPSGAPGPTSAANPFIGWNPLEVAQPNDPPGVTVTMGGHEATGSFLLDTGAQSSFLSTHMAGILGVRYVEGSREAGAPKLEQFDISHPEDPGTLLANQFTIPFAGVSGSTSAAGFFLDSLLLKTAEGDAGNPEHPDHLRFLSAPVLVTDITVQNSNRTVTLDGVLGMNYFAGSLNLQDIPLDLGGLPDDLLNLDLGTILDDPILLSLLFGNFLDSLEISESPFNWLVFDAQAGILGLDVKAAAVPLPPALTLLASALLGIFAGIRRRR